MTRLLRVALLLVVAGVAASALPSSLVTDAREAHANGSSGKRAQEVLMFGNQQNRPSDASTATNKRAGHEAEMSTASPATGPPQDAAAGAPRRHVEEHLLSAADLLSEMRKEAHENTKTVAQYEKGYHYGVGKEALEKQAENSLLKSDIYGDPTTTVNEYRYYGGGDPHHEKITPPSKRSVRYPEADASSRLKRDLELDPESLLALISLWQSQRSNHPSYRDRAEWSDTRYGYVRPEPEEDNGDDEEDISSDSANGEWLDSPVTPSRYQYQDLASQYGQYPSEDFRYNSYPNMKRSLAGYYPRYDQKMGGGQWGGFTQDKRFMVAIKRQFNHWDEPMLARLLASQPRNADMTAHRRLVL